MPSTRNFAVKALAVALGGLVVALSETSAMAQQLAKSTSCVEGTVDAYSYAELSANFREFSWDSKAALHLETQDNALMLEVYDLALNPVCERLADNLATCRWNLSPGGVYSVRIDNKARPTITSYRLCAD